MVEGFGGVAARRQEGPEQADRWRGRGAFRSLGEYQLIIDDRAMPRVAQTDQPILLAAYLDHFLLDLQVLPAIADLYLHGVVRVQLFTIEVDLIIHQHGQPPGVMGCMTEQGEGHAGEEVAVYFMFRGADVGFVPDGGNGKADMRIIG